MEERQPVNAAERSAAFLDRIANAQTDKRRAMASVRRRMMEMHLPTIYDVKANEQIDWLLDSIQLELRRDPDERGSKGHLRGGRAVVFAGPAGVGKSECIECLFRTRPEFAGYGVEGSWSPVKSVVAPSPFSTSALGNEVLRELRYQGRREVQHTKVWPVVRGLMADAGIRILHVDEAQHGDEIVGYVAAQELENTFKRMMQDSSWLVWLILSGLPELSRFCQDDPSMRRRVRVVNFEPLRVPDHVKAVEDTIARIAEVCPSVDCRSVLRGDFVDRLLHAATYAFGVVVEYVQDAICECLDQDAAVLGIGHFADVYTLRTGTAEDGLNPFVTRDWRSVTVETALYEEVVDDLGKPTGRKRRKGRSWKGETR